MQRIVFAALLCAGACQADVIQSLVTCKAPGVEIQDPTRCSIEIPGEGYAQISVHAFVQYGLQVDGPTAYVNVSAGADTTGGYPPNPPLGMATASILYSTTLTTGGPARTGWASLYLAGFLCGHCQPVSATVGPYSLAEQNNRFRPTWLTVPFLLGTPFGITAQGKVSESTYVPLYMDPAGAIGQIGVQLFEDNGSGAPGAPVALIQPIPEPGTWALCLLFCAGIAIRQVATTQAAL